MTAPAAEISGARKAAILLVQLGREQAAKVLAQLPENEVENILAEVLRLDDVDVTLGGGILLEFAELAALRRGTTEGGLEAAREILGSSSFAVDRAGRILERVRGSRIPFDYLQRLEPDVAKLALEAELPQTLALIFAHLDADAASTLLGVLDEAIAGDVAHRLAIMEHTSPEVVDIVDRALEVQLAPALEMASLAEVGGVGPLVAIMGKVGRDVERGLLEALTAKDPELADEIRALMFTFADLTSLDDRSVQLLLRECDTADLATALKGADDAVTAKIMKNLSERASANLAEEIDLLGPTRGADVEAARQKVIKALRGLEETGQIVLKRGGDDDLVE